MKTIFKFISRNLIAAFKFVSKTLLAAAVPAIFGLLFSSLVLMNTALFGLANGALARLGIDTASSALEKQVRAEAVQQERLKHSKANKKERLAKRNAAKKIRANAISKVKTTAQRNIGAMPIEAVPVLGVAVVVGGTAWEIKDLCDIMIHIDELSSLYDPETDTDETTEMCKSLRAEVDETVARYRIGKDAAAKTLDDLTKELSKPLAAIPPIYEESIKVMEGRIKTFMDFYGLGPGN